MIGCLKNHTFSFAGTPMNKGQSYETLSKRAGIAASICLIVWIVSMFCAVVLKPSDDHPQNWIGIACGLSFLGTVACAVTCLSAAVIGRFKSKSMPGKPNDESQYEQKRADDV